MPTIFPGLYPDYFKRPIDLLFSSFLLCLFSPILLITILLLVLLQKGKVFFIQQRPGKDNRLFNLVKFRTMRHLTNEKGELLPDNMRLTPFGKFIRSTSIDELPQLWNVLIGDMSIVGPRPLLPKYIPLYNNRQKRRHEVRPGITGWAQVNGRNALNWTQKFEYDVWYVDHISLRLDLKILWLTVRKVLFREGINAGDEITMQPFTGNN